MHRKKLINKFLSVSVIFCHFCCCFPPHFCYHALTAVKSSSNLPDFTFGKYSTTISKCLLPELILFSAKQEYSTPLSAILTFSTLKILPVFSSTMLFLYHIIFGGGNDSAESALCVTLRNVCVTRVLWSDPAKPGRSRNLF